MMIGMALVVIPVVVALLGIGRASRNVPEGLRGATQRDDKRAQVSFALNSTSLAAILAPVGVLLGVSCGLGLMGERRGRTDDDG